MVRAILEEKVFAYVSETLFITRAQFASMIGKWVLKPINSPSGDLRFVWMQSGPEVHFIRASAGAVNPHAWLELAEQCIKDYGLIIGKIGKDNKAAIRFVERIGGVKTGEDEYDVHYTVKGIPHAEHFHRTTA